jgi:hypothetical protein
MKREKGGGRRGREEGGGRREEGGGRREEGGGRREEEEKGIAALHRAGQVGGAGT